MWVQRLDDSLNLQFTLRIAFRCVLHRCRNQEILLLKVLNNLYFHSDFNLQRESCRGCLRRARARGREPPGGQLRRARRSNKVNKHGGGGFGPAESPPHHSVMILPQVHLRETLLRLLLPTK